MRRRLPILLLLVQYVLAIAAGPCFHRHDDGGETACGHALARHEHDSHACGGSHGCEAAPASDPPPNPTREPGGGHSHRSADDCAVCHFMAQKVLAAEYAGTLAARFVAPAAPLCEPVAAVRLVLLPWNSRAPPPAV